MRIAWRFQTRLILIVIATSYAPLLALSSLMFAGLIVRIEERTSALVRDGLDKGRLQIETTCLDMVKLTGMIRTDEGIQAALSDALSAGPEGSRFLDHLRARQLEAADYERLSRVENRIDLIKSSIFFNYEADVLVFDEQGVIYNSSDHVDDYTLKLAYMATYRAEPWYHTLTEADESIDWIAPFDYAAAGLDGPIFISVVRDVEDPRAGGRLGLVMASVSASCFQRFFEGPPGTSTALLTGPDGLVELSSAGFDRSIAEEARKRVSDSGYTVVKTGHRRDMVVLLPVARFGWVLASIIPYAQVVQDVSTLRAQVYGLTAAGYLIALAVTIALVIQATRPLRRLVERTAGISVAGRGLPAAPLPRDRTDLVTLSRAVEGLVQGMKELAEEVVEEHGKEQQLRLETLQAQINPHFLFNALNAIKWTAHMGGATSVASMLSSLGAILEAGMRIDQDEISLDAELRLLKDFLFIVNARRSDSVELIEDIEETARGCRIIKLLLQPIVENAARHARPAWDTPTVVRITARVADSVLCITVSDNGSGMVPESTAGLHGGIGLANVRERLKLRYGTDLEVRSGSGIGTVVAIRIPEVRS